MRAGPMFGATVSSTAPAPAPLAVDVTVIHGTGEAALHTQPAAVSSCSVTRAPAAATLDDPGVTPTVHPLPC